MIFLFRQVGIFPKQPVPTGFFSRDCFHIVGERELPGTRVRRDLPGYRVSLHNSSCGTCRTKSWKNMQGACRNHQRLDHASLRFFSKNGRWICFSKRVMCVWRNNYCTCMCLRPRMSLFHCVYICMVNYVLMYIYSAESYAINIPWYTIMIYNYTMYHDISSWQYTRK